MSYFVFYCYLYVSCIGSITSVEKERAIFLLSFAYNQYVVSVLRGFLFNLVLGMGCVISLWHFHIIIFHRNQSL